MTPIVNALALGYAAPQILAYLQRAFPSLAPRIKKARSSGYSIEQILNIINQGMGGKADDTLTESQIHKERGEREGAVVKDLLKLAAGSAVGYGATRLLPGALQAAGIGRAAPTPPQLPPGQTPTPPPQPQTPPAQSPIGPHPMANAPIAPPPIPTASPVVAAPAVPAQQPGAVSSNVLEQMGLIPRIESLLKAKNPPENIPPIMESLLSPGQKKWLADQIKEGKAKPLKELVGEYLKSRPKELEKGTLVASPSGGLGDIKDIKEKEALIESDGKLHKMPKDEIIQSPLPEKDLADLYNDVITGIEKETGEAVSRNVYWAGYDPQNNELAYIPHDGSLYVYPDISKEDAEALTGILTQRKTTGENYIGAWIEGTKSPIGAAMSALIKKLQSERGGKGNEYSRKYGNIYDALEPAKKLAKKKHKEEKKREKQRPS